MLTEIDLRAKAQTLGYRPEILEKVLLLLTLCEQLMAIPLLRESLVLKGGTAINLFCTPTLPRLSVDLDFNYIGEISREKMLVQKPKIDNAILDVCHRLRFSVYRNPKAHAGGKMVLSYDSLSGNKGRLELDLNYLYREPLWQPILKKSSSFDHEAQVKILDIHELVAGKLHALLDREASRDLYDSHQLLHNWKLNQEKLRLAFTIYAGMRIKRWQDISIENISCSVSDVRNKLIPVLSQTVAPSTNYKLLKPWVDNLVVQTKSALSVVLPFRKNEIAFLEQLQSQGDICPEHLTKDIQIIKVIKQHPAILWRVKQSE